MNYSHYYDKLKLIKYTTIRRKLKSKQVKDIETEKISKQFLHYAIITMIKSKPIDKISTRILLEDTKPFVKTRSEAYELIQSFYEKPIDFANEPFHIFYMNKVRIRLVKYEKIDKNERKEN